MCWTTFKSIEIIPKTVEKKEGKKVFKLAAFNKENNVIRSYFIPKLTFYYKVGKTNEEEIGMVEKGVTNNNAYKLQYSINKGLHSYSKEKCRCEETYTKNVAVYTKEQHGMLGYYVSHPRRYGHLVLLECTIPYGAKYYENSEGEIVSNKLRVDKIVDLNWNKVG